MDSVLKRKTNRPPVNQTHMVLWCHGGWDVGPRSSPCVCACVRSAGSTGSREHTPSACAVVMYATSVSNTADFLCVNSSVCQVVMVMIDALCAVMEQWIRLAPGQPHHNESLWFAETLMCVDHQRRCVGWDDNVNTIVCARTHYAYATVWGTKQMRALCWIL